MLKIKSGQPSLHAIPEIGVKANPLDGIIFESIDHKITPQNTCQGHLPLHLIVELVSVLQHYFTITNLNQFTY